MVLQQIFNQVFLMRFSFLLSALFFSWLAHAQAPRSYAHIDQHALATPAKLTEDLDSLTAYLLQAANNDYEKVRSFFIWTAYSIDFDKKAYRGDYKRINHSIDDILQRRKAVCFGYSQLMQEFFQRAEIRAQIVSGYSKANSDSQPDMKAPDHSWNAVYIEEKWYLLDVTWSRTVSDKIMITDDYFLTPSEQFIKSHLPEDPTWQLLDFPISTAQFIDGNYQPTQADSSLRFNFRDSIACYEQWSRPLRRLRAAARSYQFNPTRLMGRELSSCYLEYESELEDLALRFQEQQKYDSLLLIQQKMIRLCDQAANFSDLFSNQEENCAYNHFNYAVALASKVNKTSSKNPLKTYREMLAQFEIAHSRLSALKNSNLFTENALERCKDYIEYCNKKIRRYTR